MSKVLVTESSLSGIAAAIREKNGSSDTYNPGQMAAAIQAIPTGITPTGTVNINQNGTVDVTDYASADVAVPNSYAAADEGKVVSNGALVAQTPRSSQITANGTYDTTLNDEVTVNVSGGGGGDIPLIQKSAWDALTTAQKQAYGLVAIQLASIGYNRGILVNGADYNSVSYYLPLSDASKIDCFSIYSNFDPASRSWGVGNSPITMSSLCSRYQQEEAVYCDAKTNQNSIGLSLDSDTSDFTVYIVAKGLSYAGGDVIVMGSVGAWSSGQMIVLYHRSGTIWITSIYGSDDNLIDTLGGYVAVALRSSHNGNQIQASWFAHNGANRKYVNYTKHGTRFTLGSYSNTYSTDLAVKFVGYVNEAEDDETIASNLSNLKTIFGLS